MACGCPILTANTCAPPEVVGDAAWLVDPLDVDAIAEGMLAMLSSRELSQTYAARGLERVKEFSWERCAREVLALLESLAYRTDKRSRTGVRAKTAPSGY
jgi:glycosyltransferase involved in cell wall biosynthesis